MKKKFRCALVFLAAALLTGSLTSVRAQTAVSAGSGSYASSLPTSGVSGDNGVYGPTIADMLAYYQGGDNPSASSHMWLSPSLYSSTVAVPTNRWWEDVVFNVRQSGSSWTQQGDSSALWVYPQLVAPTAAGMWIYYPAAYEDRAYGNPVSYVNAGPYLVVSDTASGHTFSSPNPVVTKYGDWTLSYTQTDSTSTGVITTTLARGVPFTWCQYSNATPQIQLNGALADINGNAINTSTGSFTATAFSLTTRGRTFGIFAPANTTFTVANGEITPSTSVAYMVYALIPDPSHLSAFSQYAYAMPTNSQFAYTYNQPNGSVDTTWTLTTTALSGTNTQTLQGWLPHQYHNTVNNFGTFEPYAFMTPRGALMLTPGTSWNISWRFRGILPMLPAPTDGSAGTNPFSSTEMDNFINTYESTGNHPVHVAETYGQGKELGTAAQFMTLADQMGQTSTKSQILSNLETTLDDWYTYSGSGDDAYFGLLGNYGGLIGVPESFGTAAFNDNHYHYGYFVDATAITGLYDPTWLQNYAPMAELVAKEYANWDRTDTTFPYFRMFDPWEGHCWASGYGFQNGQTQESYSESMNAWVGLFTLGNALLGTNVSTTTSNNMIAAGAMGYAIEGSAVNEYYQDWKHTNFPDSYGFNGVGTLWSGWIAYQQSFSNDPAWNYAVQYLPIAGWENYQTKDPLYSSAELNDLWAERAEVAQQDIAGFGLPDANNGWNVLTGDSLSGEPGDYFMGIQALNDPATSTPTTTVSQFDSYYSAGDAVATTANLSATDSCAPGLVYYLAHSLRTLGVQDYDYYTSIPTSTVYYNPSTGVRTAVIYNPEASTQTATVYDNGTTVTTISAPSHQLITQTIGGAAMNTPPAAPTGVAATAGSGQVSLTWNAVAGATSYSVYREVSGGGYYFNNLTSTSLTDSGLSTNGFQYSYRVYAVNAEGMSPASTEVSVRVYGSGVQQATDWLYDLNLPTSTGTPGWYTNFDLNDFGYDGLCTRVQNVTSSLIYSYPNLTAFSAQVWTLNYPIASVAFLTSTNNGSTWQSQPVTVSGPTAGATGWNSYILTPSGAMPSGVTNLEITVPPAGGTQNNWDPEIGPVSFTYGGFAAPQPPTGLSASPANASATLTWTASAGATSYSVYRGTSSGGESSTAIGTTSSTTYTDSSVTNGTTYYYTVKAVNSAGTSAASNETSVTPEQTNTVTDPLSNFTIINSKSGNWTLDSSNPTYFSGDTSRATRTVDDTEYLIYKFSGITTFDALVYTLNGPISVATFYTSPDGNTWTQATVNTGSETAVSAGWGYYNIVPTGSLPSGTNYLKVQFTSGTGNAWDPQLSQISITYGGGTTSAPSTPTGLTATPGNAQVALSWTASSGATSYNIYRSATSGGEGTTAYATSATASYTDTSVTNGTTYYYTVAAVNAGGTSAQSTQVNATPQVPAPLTPTGLTATPGNAQVALSWTATSGATSYNVYRSTTSGGEGTTAIATSTTASYTNTGLTNGTKYYYTVAAVNAGGTSAQSTEVNATPQVPAPSAPTGLSATAGNAQVALTWTASSGATSYNIYRSTTSGGEGTTTYATSTTASYTDTSVTNGTTYYYTVAAVNAGGTSAQSTEVSATPSSGSQTITDYLNDWTIASSHTANWTLDSSNPTYFSGDTSRATRTVDDTESIVYTFSGITTFNAKVYIYQGPVTVATFWYSTNNGSTWTQATVTYGSETAVTAGWGYYNVVPSANLPAGVTNLKVQFTSGTGNAWDPQLSQISITYAGSGGGSAPGAPTGLTATSGNAQVALTWTASTGATSYNIYRSTTSGGEGTTAIATSTTASYTNTGLTNGTKYYYTVAAVNVSGTSAQSTEASATPQVPLPGTPTGLAATAGSGQVALTWSSTSNAATYNVYRGTSAGGESTTPITTGLTGTSYTDTSVTNGTTYYYKVAAVNAAGTSGQSNEASATPPAAGGSTSGPVSIDCGGAAASPFVADADFSGGTAGSTTSTIATPYVSTPAPPQAVLQSWRAGTFTYTLPGFTAGTGHTVSLYFMEPTATASGQRDFNVTVSGSQVLTNFDIYAATGGQFKAIQENFNGTANSSGQIVIQFTAGTAGSPIVEGIVVPN